MRRATCLLLALVLAAPLLGSCGDAPSAPQQDPSASRFQLEPFLATWIERHGAEPAEAAREELLAWFDADVGRLSTLERLLVEAPVKQPVFHRTRAVYHALGPRAVPSLLSLVVHGSKEQALRAASVLHHALPKAEFWLHENPWRERWSPEERRRLDVFEAGLIERTADADEERAQRAWFLLAALPPEARSPAGLDQLVQGIGSEDPRVMRECCYALAASTGERSACVDPLFKLLDTPEPNPDREDIVTGLVFEWARRDPAVVPHIVEHYRTVTSSGRRRDLLRSFASLGADGLAARPLFIAAAAGEDEILATIGVTGLRALGAEGEAALEALARHEDPAVRARLATDD